MKKYKLGKGKSRKEILIGNIKVFKENLLPYAKKKKNKNAIKIFEGLISDWEKALKALEE